MQISQLVSALEGAWGRFTGAQQSLHPILYFLALGWIQISGRQLPAELSLTFGFFSIFALKKNPLFMFSPWTIEQPITSLLLVPCLLSCTSRERLAIFSLAFSRSCFGGEIPRIILLFLWSLVISYMILQQLSFSTKRDNSFFFVGFCVTSAYSIITFTKLILNWNFNIFLQAIFLLAIFSIAVQLFAKRLRKLFGSKPQELQYEGQMRIYMENIAQMLGNSVKRQTVMLDHKKICNKLDCFCKDKHNRNTLGLLKHLFQFFLSRLGDNNEGLIRERYIEYHLGKDQIINAVWQLKRFKPLNYFGRASVIRMYSKINNWNQRANSSNVFGKQFEYGLRFDGILMELARRAVEVIQFKKRFWRQLGRESPRVGLLQETGNATVKLMYDLNQFYAGEVRVKEQKLSLLDGTALYAVFLLSTTNFREYAESLIKASAKTMQQARLFGWAQTETYTISAEVHTPTLSLFQNSKPLAINKTEQPNQKELIIRSVSLGLCRILGYERDEVLGKELQTIIPVGYKQVHKIRLSSLFNFESSNQVTSSKILHRDLSLPMKGTGNRIVVGRILIKISPNSRSELCFISVIKLLNTRTKSALLDGEGVATQIQDGFEEQLLQHSQLQRYYHRAKETWLMEGTMPQERFNIVANASNYTVCMNSPLLALFVEKGNLVQTAPPVHVEITNQVSNRRVRNDVGGRIGHQFNKMEAVLNIEAESSTASSKSSTSAVNILNAFSETYSTVYYRLLQVVFLVIMLICTACSIGAHFSSGLQWISSWESNNPINDTMNLHALHLLTIKMLLVKGSLDTYYGEPAINKTTIASYFPNPDFQQYSIQAALKLENAFKNSIQKCLKSQSVFKQQVKLKLQQILNIMNPYFFSQIESMIMTYQQLSYLQILMIYASDANLLARKRNNCIFAYSYSVEISQWQNSTKFELLIDDKIENSSNLSLILHLVLIAIIIALIIPLFCLLRRRAHEHTVVFDILASVEANMTSKQVDSLRYVENILINFKDVDQTLKNNVLDYQANALIPKGPPRRRASAENELVIGLEEYDRINNRSQFVSFHSGNSNDDKNAEKASFLSFVRKGFDKTVGQKQVLRRRDGEIDLKDSWMNSEKKIIGSHLLLYVLIGFSALFLLLGLIMNKQFTTVLQQGKKVLFFLYQEQLGVYNMILTNKVLTRNGVDFTSLFFGIPDILNMLVVPLNQAFPYYDYAHDFPVAEVPACQGVVYQKLCQYRTNQIILKSQLGSVLKDIVQLRYNYDKGKIPYNWSKEEAQAVIRQKDLYVDSIVFKLEEIAMQQISLISDKINHEALEYANRKQGLLLMGVAWIVCATIIGIWVILRQKQLYFRQVFLITFLNREMIAKNKRVESFLQRLAKNNGV